jgi:hypothetical protein
MANVGPLLSHSICTVSLVPNPGWANLGLLALDASIRLAIQGALCDAQNV